MYELSKQILEKVSFDKMLFRKELTKAVKWLKPDERMLLYAWCLSTFGHMYKDVIVDVYKTIVRS
ncbi:MAG: hypothetical protein AB1458_04360 [Bacteroidota bacterium]